jgi:hypothetical protein
MDLPLLENDITGSEYTFKMTDTWNFVFEMAPSADNCIVGPDYSTEAYF